MDSKYSQEVSMYGKKDAIIALCVYVVFLIWGIVSWVITDILDGTLRQTQIIGMISAFILSTLVIAIVLIRKQKISSLGIHKDKLGLALRLGFIFALIPLSINLLFPAILYDLSFTPFGHMMWMMLYFFFMAAYEDIFFIGFLQTRLYGLFKSDKVAIGIGAALFALIHVPVALADGGLGLLGPEIIFYLAGLFFMHQALVLMFRRYFSLFTVMLIHLAINWSYTSIWRWTAETNYAFFWGSVTGLVFIVGANTWDWCMKKRMGKAAQ